VNDGSPAIALYIDAMTDRIVVLRITGLVQGVGFRAFVQREAERLVARGWVRNRRDGSVEALVAGAPDIVGEMIIACRRGPAGSLVEAVEVTASSETPPGSFRVLPTL
jgi:acylphosphatase